jgi:hypothetical protein
MHVVEELWAMFSSEELTGHDSTDTETETTETICSISVHALTGATPATSGVIQLQAFIARLRC